jgi:hypothetical protein
VTRFGIAVVVLAFAGVATAEDGKCPSPPDSRNPACRPKPPPPEAPQPVFGRIIGTAINGSDTFLTVGVGSYDGIKKTWNAVITTTDRRVVPGGEVDVLRVDTKVTVVRMRSAFKLAATASVRFTPP